MLCRRKSGRCAGIRGTGASINIIRSGSGRRISWLRISVRWRRWMCCMLEDLEEDFNPYVKVIYNPLYIDHNNIQSMNCALDKLGDTFVIDGDLVIMDLFLLDSLYLLF